MSTIKDIEQRLRAARPAADVPSVLSLFRGGQANRRGRVTNRSLVAGRVAAGSRCPIVVGALVLAAASAGAAILLSSGETVAPAFASLRRPRQDSASPFPPRWLSFRCAWQIPEGGPP